jgi:GH24 family phage-related lysozyme (muramidase)
MPSPCVVAVLPSLSQHEGIFSFLYLDQRGNPTCAMGRLVPNVAASQQLPWQPNDALTIGSDYNIVSAMPAGKVAVYYEEATICRLPDGWAEQDAAQRLETEFLPPLRAMFAPGVFDGFPLTVQMALMDMIYNIGAGGLRKYVHMLAACSGGNWTGAAAECHRNGISEQRNEWTVSQFQAAANATSGAPAQPLPTETAGK